MRVVRNLLAFLFLLTGAAVVAAVLTLHLAATGRNLPMLRSIVGAVGRTIAGQQTTALSLAVRVQPDARRLSGTARLTVRSAVADRRYLYFLLNDGLRAQAAWEEGAGGTRTPLRLYRVWLLTVVELPRRLGPDEEIRIGIDYAGQPHSVGVGAGGMVLEPDDVVITPADFWYPADLQGFFLADVEILLPARLTLVHNGREASHNIEGTSARVRFATERPVPSLALVAGRYQEHASERNGLRSRALLPADVRLDPQRLLDALADSQQSFAAHYGQSGFTQTSLFVNRRLRRAFNDGTGLIGIPTRSFADGDHGFELVAHEVSHNWWGATVAEHWLQPGTGGEWIVEGFAEFSGWRALREHRGEAALLRAQSRAFFDPDRTVALQAMSVVDNGLDPGARATIYNKGGWVTAMLQQRLGDEAFDAAARQFLDQFRYRPATAGDAETVFSAATQQDLAPFFAAWVRGNESIDLALDAQDGGAVVRNHRTAPAPDELALWRFPPGSEPEKQSTSVGASTPIGNAERVVLDPLASVADMFRSNNVLPRHDNPRAVATSARGDLMTVVGEPYAWEPAIIEVAPRGGAAARSWVVDRGLMSDPMWSADGTRILAVESPRGGEPTLLALNATDGSRETVSHDTIAAGAADGTIVARGGHLLRLASGETTLLAEYPGGRILAPIAAPEGGALAYAVAWETQSMDLRVLPGDGGESRVLFTWPATRLRWRWSPDGARLYAALPGDWDWQLWEIALDGTPPRLMVREAAAISDLAVAPGGDRIAIVAQAEIDDPLDRSEVFVADRRSSDVRRFNLGGRTAFSAAWRDDDGLVVVVADPTYPSLPIYKQLRTLRLSDGSLEPFP
jgi:Peptidase family M1 domain